jgi:hypothetical protein
VVKPISEYGNAVCGMFYVPKFNCEISNISGQKDKGILLKLILKKVFLMRTKPANGVPKRSCKTSTDAKKEIVFFPASSLKTN